MSTHTARRGGSEGVSCPSCFHVARITVAGAGSWVLQERWPVAWSVPRVLGLSSWWRPRRGWDHRPWACLCLSFSQWTSTSGCSVLEDIRVTLNFCLGFPQQEWPIVKVPVTSRALALSAGPWRRRVCRLTGRGGAPREDRVQLGAELGRARPL